MQAFNTSYLNDIVKKWMKHFFISVVKGVEKLLFHRQGSLFINE